ncbi:putative permease [Salmonella enterica subsp. enterica]|uniref:Putative permease n=1 Tax=Salmonella enterica I TaxID=59201 RepID=A0A379X109_SALET|nr:putative permease [Salmonella enterica subsp. enterica]
MADSGHLTQLRDGSQVVTLNKGTRFEGTALLRDFRITDFQNYQAIIGHQAVALDPNDTDQMDMRTLWNTDNRSRSRRAALAYHVSLYRIYDGADGRAAQRGESTSGARLVYVARHAALSAVLPDPDLH